MNLVRGGGYVDSDSSNTPVSTLLRSGAVGVSCLWDVVLVSSFGLSSCCVTSFVFETVFSLLFLIMTRAMMTATTIKSTTPMVIPTTRGETPGSVTCVVSDIRHRIY